MVEINRDDMLSRIHQFKLDRPDGWCYVSVHEVIASEKARVKCIAVPNLALQQADRAYFGTGDTVEDALSECLAKIRSVAMADLFPRMDAAYEEAGLSGRQGD